MLSEIVLGENMFCENVLSENVLCENVLSENVFSEKDVMPEDVLIACMHLTLLFFCSFVVVVVVPSLFSLLQAKPLLTLAPSSTYMMSVAWSKVRPLVFSAT